MNKLEEDILTLSWEEEERTVLKRILTYFKSWKRWIPKTLEDDIIFVLKLAIKEKKKINELIKLVE